MDNTYNDKERQDMKKYIIPTIEIVKPMEPLMQTLGKESDPNDDPIYGKENDTFDEWTIENRNVWED